METSIRNQIEGHSYNIRLESGHHLYGLQFVSTIPKDEEPSPGLFERLGLHYNKKSIAAKSHGLDKVSSSDRYVYHRNAEGMIIIDGHKIRCMEDVTEKEMDIHERAITSMVSRYRSLTNQQIQGQCSTMESIGIDGEKRGIQFCLAALGHNIP